MPSPRLRFLLTSCSLTLVGVPAWGQAVPTASSTLSSPTLNLGLLNGTFRYAINLSEVIQTGYIAGQDVTTQTNISGSLAYSTKSEVHPFGAIYSGGVQFTNEAGYGNTVFQSLALSQGYNTRNWSFNLADIVSYLPQSPTVGLSGIPGAGDLGLYPVTGLNTPAQDVLTYNSTRVVNTVNGSAARRLSARTSITADAGYSILHFFNNTAYDTQQENADLGVNHVLDARTSIGAGVTYSIFQYGTNSGFTPYQNAAVGNASFQTKGVYGRIQRQLTRSINVTASAGPQWVSSSQSLGIPSRLTTQASGSLSYTRHFGTLSAYASRGVNGGSGVLPGALTTSVGGAFGRTFGRDWSASVNAGYGRTSGLASGTGGAANLAALGIANYSNFDSTFAGAQVNRRLTQSFSAYASYTAFNQSYGNYYNFATPGAVNTLGNLVQSFAIGISYSPRSFNLGQF